MSVQTITLKFKDVDVEKITCESVKMGKDIVPLIRYGTDKKTLFIQGPWLKMKQYGIPAGEFLSNGIKNDYYTGEESRLSVRFPVDASCCVNIDNSDITKAKALSEKIIFWRDAVGTDDETKKNKALIPIWYAQLTKLNYYIVGKELKRN